MNVVITIALILALASAESSIRYRDNVSNNDAAPRGVNLNHNETLVRDTARTLQADDWSLRLNVEQAVAAALSFISFPMYQSHIAGCGRWGCGLNHNETLVRDTVLTQRTDDLSLWPSVEQAFAVAQRFFPFPIYQSRIAGCGRWGCGTNHNETMVHDAPPMK